MEKVETRNWLQRWWSGVRSYWSHHDYRTGRSVVLLGAWGVQFAIAIAWRVIMEALSQDVTGDDWILVFLLWVPTMPPYVYLMTLPEKRKPFPPGVRFFYTSYAVFLIATLWIWL